MLRFARASLLAGGLVAGGVVVAVASSGANPAPAVVAANQSLSTTLLSNRGAASTPGTTVPGAGGAKGYGFGRGGRHGGYDGYDGYGEFGFGRGLTVTGVSGSTITATGRGSQTITVQVSATTAYTEAGTSASLSDVKVGSIIAVRGANTGTGYTGAPSATSGATISATAITIVLPQVAGVVTGVSGSTLTITGFDGATRTVTVTDSTRYQKAGQSAALSNITSGTAIAVEGTANGDGSLTAVRVTIQVPRVAGQVTAVNGSSYTVAGRFGQSYTVATTGSTTYANANGSTASAAAVTTNTYIVAEGTLSSDGKTLTAQRVIVAPTGAGNGYGRRDGFGGRGGFGRYGYGAGAPDGGATGSSSSAPSTSTSGMTSF